MIARATFSSRRFAPALALGALVLAVYGPSWPAGFIWDDDLHVSANPHMRSAAGLVALWTTPAANYCPLTMTTFWLLHAAFGLDPLPYHLANVALHALAGGLLWRVLARLRIPGAWLGAALWTLHPVQVESVAWISELKNTQSAVFFLLSIGSFITHLEAPDRARRWRAYGWSLGWAMLAILSKSSTVMLPAILVLLGWWRTGRIDWGRELRLAPFFLVALAAAAWTIWEQKFSSLAQGPDWEMSFAARVAGAARVSGFYLGKLFWPEPLIFIYPRWTIEARSLAAWLPWGAAVAVGAGLIWMRRAPLARATLFAAGCFAVLLFPVLGFFDVYFFRFSYVGDHLQYLASMAPLALLGALATRLAGRASAAAGGLLIAALALSSHAHVPQYRSNLALFSATVAKNPQAWMAQSNLAAALTDANRLDEALVHARAALALRANYGEAENNLGRIYTRLDRPGEALPHFERALALNPGDLEARNNLGTALAALGRLQEAHAAFADVLRRAPAHEGARLNAGLALALGGDFAGAQRAFAALLATNPDHAQAEMNLGLALAAQGRTEAALPHLARAAQLDPADARIHAGWGRGLIAAGRLPEAAEKLETALRLDPRDRHVRALLGQLLRQLGQATRAAEIEASGR